MKNLLCAKRKTKIQLVSPVVSIIIIANWDICSDCPQKLYCIYFQGNLSGEVFYFVFPSLWYVCTSFLSLLQDIHPWKKNCICGNLTGKQMKVLYEKL